MNGGGHNTLEKLNAPGRLDYLREIVGDERAGGPVPEQRDVNNHIHTSFSFSPYSPAAAVWFARRAGLATCGIMDHDTMAGAPEFLEAAGIAGIAATIGLECRVSFQDTPFAGRRINNPDQDSNAYISIYGVPHDQIGRLNAYFAPLRALRSERNRRMAARVNDLLSPYGIAVDYDADVLPLSEFGSGGTVTERHISMALAKNMIAAYGRGAALIDLLANKLKVALSEKLAGYLRDEDNPHMVYDLLGIIKSGLVPRFYIDATDECPDAREILRLSEEAGGISAYAYLGDVGESVTGDKRAQSFEDEYLDDLAPFLRELGFRAITYMPSRNTPAQLNRARGLCGRYGFLQISGEDINSPRQPFACAAQRGPEFDNLREATWALIAHERRAAEDPSLGLYSAASMAKWPDLNERMSAFSRIGKTMSV